MLADEDELLHTVAVAGIPVALEVGVVGLEGGKLVGGHGGIPLSGIAEGDLLAGLLEDVAGVGLTVEPTNAFRTDDGGRPLAGHELIEETEVQGGAAVIDEGSDAVLLGFAFIVVMMVVVVVVIIIIFIMVVFDFIYPGGGGGDAVEVEGVGVEELLEGDVAIIALDDFGFGLEGTDDLTDTAELIGCHLGGFVQEDEVAELDLLNDEVLDVVLVQIGTQEVLAAAELVAHTEGIDDGGYAIDDGDAVADVFEAHRGDGADGLRDGSGFADAAGLDDDVVETLLTGDVAELFDEIHLQRAADAPVLKGYEVVVLLGHYPTLLNEVGIDVDFADVVDDDGETDAATVVEDTVQECGLAAAEVTGQEQYGNGLRGHIGRFKDYKIIRL